MITSLPATVRSSADVILDRWARHVRGANGGRTRRGLPMGRAKANIRPLLEAVLAAAASREALASFEKDGPAYLAAKHFGELRQQQGFEVRDLMEEMRHLRREVVAQLVDAIRPPSPELIEAIGRVDDAIDRANGIAVETYHGIAVETLTELVALDPLTGLYDYGYLWDRLEQEVQRARRHGHALSVVMLDVDWFKQYNDEFGHLWGDVALKEIASILQAIGRRSDIAARYGGDEFVVILPETGLDGAATIGQRAVESVSTHRFRGKSGEIVALTVSVGCATISEDMSSARDLVARADAALYDAKRRGKNRIALPVEAPSR